jgi:hypothetical protein
MTKQFNRRVPLLAAAVGVQGASRTRCDRLYSLRSDEAHGRETWLLSGRPEVPDKVYDEREVAMIANLALFKTCSGPRYDERSKDDAFRAHFDDAASV